MKPKDLSQLADKVIELKKHMYSTFEGSEDDFLKVAMMAGFQDAYNHGVNNTRFKVGEKESETWNRAIKAAANTMDDQATNTLQRQTILDLLIQPKASNS